MSRSSFHTNGCRVSDEWTFRGMRAAVLENELLRIVVLLDKGAEIIEFRYKPLDFDPLLRIPGPVRNPVQSGSQEYLDNYLGGWQEILPNGGAPASHKGVNYGQHGEVSVMPWSSDVLDVGPERASICCSVRALRTPLFIERTMSLERGKAVLYLDERVTNEAGEPLDMMWGHHVAFGLPFLQPGATIATSARTLLAHEELPGFEPRRLQLGQRSQWPWGQASGATNGSAGQIDMSIVPPQNEANGREMAYLTDFDGPAWYAITNRAQQAAPPAGFAMRWDASVFRYLWLWQEFAYPKGFPWWGRTYTMALEPWSSYPTLGLPEAVKRNSQITLQPGQSVQTRLTATAYAGLATVSGVKEDGTVL